MVSMALAVPWSVVDVWTMLHVTKQQASVPEVLFPAHFFFFFLIAKAITIFLLMAMEDLRSFHQVIRCYLRGALLYGSYYLYSMYSSNVPMINKICLVLKNHQSILQLLCCRYIHVLS